jgi:hypothetical protein
VIAPIAVPENLRPAIQLVLELDQKSANRVLEALKTVTPSLDVDGLASQLKDLLRGVIDEDKTEWLTSGLLAITSGPLAIEVNKSEFAEALAASPDLNVPESRRASARDRFLSFMDIDSVLVTARALDVLSEQPARFVSARILSDLRPVFGSNIDARPSAAVIVHNLRITYNTARRQEQFFVALDAEDLDSLDGAITRARRKAKSMSSMLRSLDVPDVSPSGKESTSA